jgi:hypothetical protein
MVKGESIFDGSIDLYAIALMNDSLLVRQDNERIAARLRAEKNNGH